MMSYLQKFLYEMLNQIQPQRLQAQEGQSDYDIFAEIAGALITARMEENLTQGELSRRCGISQANISKFET